MKFEDLIRKVSHLPAFKVSFLAAGGSLEQIRLQISRWVNDGKVIRLHKGLYTLSEPYRKTDCQPFCIVNSLKKASYVSLQSALSWHGIIPEYVPATTCVTTDRPQTIETPLARFEFRHVSNKYFWGYQQVVLASEQTAFIACPEKALLDLVYLTPGSDKMELLEELRLQNFEKIDVAVLMQFAERFNSPKIKRAACMIEEILKTDEGIEL
jgi:predicted transcriptional regulator of viral defense system